MAEQDHFTSVQSFVDSLNEGNLDSIRQVMSDEFFAYAPAGDEPTQADVYYDLVSQLRTAFPDMHVIVSDMRFEDDLIKGQMTLQGTHNGPIWGAPPSGGTAEWTTAISLRPIGDRYAVSFDNVSLPELLPVLRSIDLVPPADQMDRPLKYPVVMPEIMIKVLFTGQVADKPCSHLDAIQVTETDIDLCEQCVATGDVWPALRMCLICGHVGCCDTSKNKHAKQHYEETGHALMRSIRLDESWVWCYEDNAFFSGRILENYG